MGTGEVEGTPASSGPPPACGRPADRPRSHSPPAVHDRPWSPSRHRSAPPASSSGKASATRPAQAYAQPRAAAVSGNQNRMLKTRQESRPRSSTGMALERSLWRRRENRHRDTHRRLWVIDHLGDADRFLLRMIPRGTLPARQGTGLTRHARARQAGRSCRSAHGSDHRQATPHCSAATPSPDDGRPEYGRPHPGSDAP